MVIHLNILCFARINGAVYGNQKVFPPGIAQNGLQFSCKPNFDLVVLFVFDVLGNAIERTFILIYCKNLASLKNDGFSIENIDQVMEHVH
jgi:hypothetical protein